MNNTLSRFSILLLVLLLLPSCAYASVAHSEADTECSVLLLPTEDMGEEYLDSFIFFGESTTYHMKDREVLRDGKETRQIWAPDSGTVNLNLTTSTLPLRYPDTGEQLTLGEAAARKKPRYLVLTFGLNGAVQKVKRGEAYYKACYRALIDCVREASPDTRIILQSAFPVSDCMDVSRYSVSVEELNGCIDRLNLWTRELSEEYGLRYLNTAEILKDEQGFLRSSLQVGDGHHLTREAYLEILYYIRTHGYQ